MKTVLIAYASRMGSTQEIASAIGDRLADRGFAVEVVPAADAAGARDFDAVLLGSAVYLGRWEKEAISYLKREATALGERPTWLFQSGPSGPASEARRTGTPRVVKRLCRSIGLAEPTTFGGNLDPARAKGRLARWVSKGDLAGDFRDWEQIRSWADDVADQLGADQPAAGA